MDWLRSTGIGQTLRAAALVSLLGQPVAISHPGGPIVDHNTPGATPTIVTVKMSSDRHELQEMATAGYDIAGVDLVNNTFDIVVRGVDYALSVEMNGFDVTEYRPVPTSVRPDSRYTTSEELEKFLHKVTLDSTIARLKVIGRSHEGRPIYAVKISDQPTSRELGEPTILFNAMHHAREIMTTEVAMDIIEQLITGYEHDANIQEWIDNNEIWVVPMVNPDGNHKVWNSYNMWRKNSRGGYGVDLNRNYPWGWNTCNGSSGQQRSNSYRGPSPGSEPETQALMSLVDQIQPVFSISYHSYSEMVLYPFGCAGQRSTDRATVEGIGKNLAAKLVRDSGEGHYVAGTPWELLYSADGGDIDWMHGRHGVIPYVVEINSSQLGFQPSYNWRQPTIEKMRPGWQYLLDSLSSSAIRGVVRNDEGRPVAGDVNLTVTSLSDQVDIPKSFQTKRDGTFHIVLKPGMYQLQASYDGIKTVKDVVVGESRVDEDLIIGH